MLGSATVDGYGTQWFYWFAGEVAAGRQGADHTDLLFFPWGKELFAHTGNNLLDAWLALPLRVGFGPALGYDLWIALLLASNAVGGVLLARRMSAPPWVAALSLVVNPYVLAEIDLGRPTQAWLFPAALAVWGLTGVRTWEVLVGGAAVALCGWTYWYYGLVLGVVAVVHAAWRVAAGPERAKAMGRQALAGVLVLALVFPGVRPMLGALEGGEVPGRLAVDGSGTVAPLALRTVEGDEQGLYVVAPLLGKAGSLLDVDGLRFNEGLPAMGLVHLAVFVVAGVALARHADRRRWGWVIVAAVLLLGVASGPLLNLGFTSVANRPWIELVAASDVLRRWWWPGRAIALFHVLLVPLLAWGAGRVSPRVRALLGVGWFGLIAAPLRADGLAPLAAWDATPPPLLTCLRDAPEGAVIDLPILVDQKNLWFQTVHQHPILGGMLLKKAAFAPPEVTRLRREDPLVSVLEVIGEKQYTRRIEPVAEADRQRVIDLGYRYVLARIDAFRRPRGTGDEVEWVSEWGRPRRQMLALLGEPAAEDDTLAIWTLDGAKLACP